MQINWKIISIIFGILLLVGGSIEAYSYIYDKGYLVGVIETTLIINQQILNSLEQNGYVSFIFEKGNQTINIKLVPQLPNE